MIYVEGFELNFGWFPDGTPALTDLGPFFGILDEIPSGAHVGSPAVKRIVDEFHPILALSGHIHEAIGCKVIDGTTFVNPGPAKEGYCAVIDVSDGKVGVEMLGPASE